MFTNDFKISDIEFYFILTSNQSLKKIYLCKHSSNKIYRAKFNLWFWEKMKGFYHTPQFIYSIAEIPDDTNIVLTGTKGFGPMISFDEG